MNVFLYLGSTERVLREVAGSVHKSNSNFEVSKPQENNRNSITHSYFSG